MNTRNSKSQIRHSILAVGFFIIVLINVFADPLSASTNITVQDFSFSPSNVVVVIGDTVRWTWIGPRTHTTTCNGIFPGTSFPPGASPWDAVLDGGNPVFEYIVMVEGDYHYACQLHPPDMIGTITAQAPLPVELSDFVATTIKNEVILDWSTTGEMNNEKFEIQRVNVTKGADFDPKNQQYLTVGYLSGNGTSNQSHHYRFIDKNLETGTYLYRLKQFDYNSNFRYHSLHDEINIGSPEKFILDQNYPNPFNPSTIINYELPYAGNVKVSVFNSQGKEVLILADEYQDAGYKNLRLNGINLTSGVYFYRVILDNGQNIQSVTKKMILSK